VKFRHFEINTEEARIIREKNNGPHAEPRAEMTQEESIQAREIHSKHQRASKKGRALRFAGTANGELEVVQEQFHRHQPPPMEEICQFSQAVRWKDETTNSCCRSGKIVLARLHDPPQVFKQLFEDPLFLVKVRPYNSIFAFTSMGESLAENSRIDEQLANAPEARYTFRIQGTIYHGVCTLLSVESRTPTFGQLYVFDSDMEAQVNMQGCIMNDLDRVIMATIQK